MRFELFLVMIFFLSILLICAELLWLYLLADNQEESKAKLNKKEARCRRILEAIICAPTQSAWECEINELVNLVEKMIAIWRYLQTFLWKVLKSMKK